MGRQGKDQVNGNVGDAAPAECRDGSDVFVDRSSRLHRDGEIAVAAASSAEGYVDVEMAYWHDRIYASVPAYRRRISPASEHSTRPMISSEVMAARHSARLRPVADGR